MIDENNGCVKKSKLIITAKTFNKYNDWSSVAAKQTDSETQKLTNMYVENILKEEKDKLTNRRTNRFTRTYSES